MTRIIHDPMVERAGRRDGVSVCLYSPELAKYGGPEGMEDAEILFQKSSQACADNRVWTWSPLERLMAAIDYIGAVEREGGFEPGALSARIADRWADINRVRCPLLVPESIWVIYHWQLLSDPGDSRGEVSNTRPTSDEVHDPG